METLKRLWNTQKNEMGRSSRQRHAPRQFRCTWRIGEIDTPQWKSYAQAFGDSCNISNKVPLIESRCDLYYSCLKFFSTVSAYPVACGLNGFSLSACAAKNADRAEQQGSTKPFPRWKIFSGGCDLCSELAISVSAFWTFHRRTITHVDCGGVDRYSAIWATCCLVWNFPSTFRTINKRHNPIPSFPQILY